MSGSGWPCSCRLSPAGAAGSATILALVRTLAGRGHSLLALARGSPPARPPARPRGGTAPARTVRAGPGRSAQRLLRLDGRGRGGGHRLGDRGARAAPPRLRRARLPRAGLRAGLLPRLRGGALGGADLRAGPLPRHGRPVARRAPARALRRTRGVVRARRRPRALPPGRRRSAATTPWSCTRAAQPRGGRCRSRCWRWPSSTAGAATCAWCCSGRSIRCAPRSPTSTPASCPSPSSPGSTARQPSGSRSRSPTTRA